MSRINTRPRHIAVKETMVTIIDPRVDLNQRRPRYILASDYIQVPRLSTIGTWPVTHMVDEDTFVQMAILAGHVSKRAVKQLRGGK